MKRKKEPLQIYDVITPGEEVLIKALYKKYNIFFDKATEILKLGFKILPLDEKPLKSTVDPGVINALLALYVAAFGFFRAIIILCKSGLDREALVQLRCLVETASYLLYIAEKDHEERLERYLHSIALSQKSALDQFVSAFPDSSSSLETKWYQEKFDEAISYFREKHGKDKEIKDIKKKYTLRPDIAGQSIEDKMFIKHYQVFYPHASAVGHGQSIVDYIKAAQEEGKFLLRASPTDKFVKFCLIHATIFFFLSTKRINELLKLGKDSAINSKEKELFDFVEKNYTKSK